MELEHCIQESLPIGVFLSLLISFYRFLALGVLPNIMTTNWIMTGQSLAHLSNNIWERCVIGRFTFSRA